MSGKEKKDKHTPGPSWTSEQEKAIDQQGCSILVSAAAGSGKTAVLTERILRKISRRENPVDIDRILIVTYTEAAAMEMRERIQGAIEKKLEEDPTDENLMRQAALLHSAPISTIHSFCLSVIRENFHRIDLDPGFRIADEGELRLVRQDVMDRVLERYYAKGKKEFLDFVDMYARGRKDTKVEELIWQLHEYSMAYPLPKRWIAMCARMYEPEYVDTLWEKAARIVHLQAGEFLALARENERLTEQPDGPYMYGKVAQADRRFFEALAKAHTYDQQADLLSDYSWSRLPSAKDDAVDPEKREQFKAVRDDCKKGVKELSASFFFETKERLAKDIRDCAPVASMLVELVNAYAEELSWEKRSRGIIDFHDMEQFALQILTKPSDDGPDALLVPTETAREYQERFEEVMIDEYQDSNLLQETILGSVSRIPWGVHNLFTVGDVKQSIYSFRLSRPELFMERYDRYKEDGPEMRIDLHRNFRSRREVLSSVNELFHLLMFREIGGVDYDDKAALYPGASYPPDEEGQYKTELLVLDGAEVKESGLSSREAQAHLIARRIQDMMDSMHIWDGKLGENRPLRYSDIAILARGAKKWTTVAAEVFGRYNIPVEAVTSEGYFTAYEVRLLLDLLRLLDNRMQDIPLAGVMGSFFGGFTEEEMAAIRLYRTEEETPCQDEPDTQSRLMFCEQVYRLAEDAAGALKEDMTDVPADKVRSFVEWMDGYRARAHYEPIHKLLWELIRTSGYDLYVRSMPGGERRYANVMMLLEKAAAFEQTSYRGLFHFVRYIEQLEKYEVDFGQAQSDEGGAGRVKIMSIHKSKGLEFPVVIVAGLSDGFNRGDLSGSVLLHSKLGAGLDVIDPKKRTKAPTLLRRLMVYDMKTEQMGEEQRVLYVAMTRPKQKLIMTGVAGGALIDRAKEKERPEMEEEAGDKKQVRLSCLSVQNASSMLDWIAEADAIRPLRHTQIRFFPLEEVVGRQLEQEVADAMARSVLENWPSDHHPAPGVLSRLRQEADNVYPHADLAKTKRKYSVSELKHRSQAGEQEEEGTDTAEPLYPLTKKNRKAAETGGYAAGAGETVYVPSFAGYEEGDSARPLTAAQRGTAFHKVMELWPFDRMPEEITDSFLEDSVSEMVDRGYLSRQQADTVTISALREAVSGPLGRRMAAAAARGELYRESPFVMGMDLTLTHPAAPGEEMVLVQGIIDAYFIEDGKIIVADYKTDRISDGRKLGERYKGQLDYYGKALERMTGLPVREKIIYSTCLGEAFSV